MRRNIQMYWVRLFAAFVMVVGVGGMGFGQEADHYVLLSDNNGFDVSGYDRNIYEPELESVAAELVEMLRAEDAFNGTDYGENFKVFDYSYYLHNSKMEDGVNLALSRAMALANLESKYYMLIAKESSELGLYHSVKIILELPDIENTCYSDEDYVLYCQNAFDANYQNNYLKFMTSAPEAISTLNEKLSKALIVAFLLQSQILVKEREMILYAMAASQTMK